MKNSINPFVNKYDLGSWWNAIIYEGLSVNTLQISFDFSCILNTCLLKENLNQENSDFSKLHPVIPNENIIPIKIYFQSRSFKVGLLGFMWKFSCRNSLIHGVNFSQLNSTYGSDGWHLSYSSLLGKSAQLLQIFHSQQSEIPKRKILKEIFFQVSYFNKIRIDFLIHIIMHSKLLMQTTQLKVDYFKFAASVHYPDIFN